MKVKNYSNTFLYGKTKQYENKLVEFIMESERINKNDNSFEDIKLQVKRRQVTNILYTVLENDNIVLLYGNIGLPKAFKVFTAKDIKTDNNLRVFIDCSGIMKFENGIWKISSVDILVAYLVSAMTNYIYYREPDRILIGSSDISKYGAGAFSSLFTNIINYLYKISVLESRRDDCKYLSSLYYSYNILGENIDSDRALSVAKRVSNISDRQVDILQMGLNSDSFKDIKIFIDTLAEILRLDKLTIDIFIEKWIYLYGTGTHFSTEYFPAFASMLTDAYVGCYINNQKTIEKETGGRMIDFTKALFRLGEAVMK